jgi:hypothetical protein
MVVLGDDETTYMKPSKTILDRKIEDVAIKLRGSSLAPYSSDRVVALVSHFQPPAAREWETHSLKKPVRTSSVVFRARSASVEARLLLAREGVSGCDAGLWYHSDIR